MLRWLKTAACSPSSVTPAAAGCIPPPGRKSDAIKQGLGQTNELRLVTQGNVATFYINDQQVTAIHGFPPTGGSLLGLHAESGASSYTWQFSEFKVTKPPADGAAARSPADSSTILTDNFATLDPAWGFASDQLRVDGNARVTCIRNVPIMRPITRGIVWRRRYPRED